MCCSIYVSKIYTVESTYLHNGLSHNSGICIELPNTKPFPIHSIIKRLHICINHYPIFWIVASNYIQLHCIMVLKYTLKIIRCGINKLTIAPIKTQTAKIYEGRWSVTYSRWHSLSTLSFLLSSCTSIQHPLLDMSFVRPQRKRNDLTLADKVKVIQMLNGVFKISQTEVAKKFRCSQSQVCRANKNKAAILQQWEANANPNRKRKREGKDVEVEDALLRWFVNARAKSVPLSGPTLMETAKALAESLGDPDFKPTEGWLSRWKERNNIVFRRVQKKDTDTQSDEDWVRDVLPTILQQYEPDCIYNCNETSLLYSAIPNRTLTLKTEKFTSGKNSMDRITILFACNMSGTDKLIPLVIGHSKNQRCFHGRKVPLPWYANKQAWMTAEIFAEWVKKTDYEMGWKHKKIILLLDNCTAHPSDIQLSNIRLVFLPANMTSFIQPIDQGIIRNFKALYRSQMLKRILQAVDNNADIDSAADLVKQITILDALYMVREAWKNVSQETIRNCFRKGGFSSAVSKDGASENVAETSAVVVPPEGIATDQFEWFVDIDAGLESTRDHADEKICQEVRAAEDDSSAMAELDDKDTDPVPCAAQLQAAFDVIRDWMQVHDFADYSSFMDIEGRVQSFCMHAKKQMAIADFKPVIKLED
ncbi:tigger transposable element-derived protein 4-like [Anguilla rostrata]|uniref:tigger transposable element-derived protein 4-like n=1 Tax=Anguilla rostrata TaxID=7938 RepID=UPI0030CCA67B